MSAPPEEAIVEVIVEEPGWEGVLPDLHRVATEAAELALGSASLDPAGFSVSLLACDDTRIAALNTRFRGKAEPTNVLAWPAFSLAPARAGDLPARPPQCPGGGRTPLGDVAIALQTVSREAENGRLPLKNHALHLILHGCLHLLGFDHLRTEDAELMEGVERRALASVGLPDPYS